MDKIFELMKSGDITSETPLTVRVWNDTPRYDKADDAFPVFDVTVTGIAEQILSFLMMIDGTHDGGFETQLLHAYLEPQGYEKDQKIEYERVMSDAP